MDAFTAGIILLVINPLIGWGGAVVSTLLYVRYKRKGYLLLGGVIYALSWVMLFVGVYLAKEKGIALVKKYFNYLINGQGIVVAVFLLFLAAIVCFVLWRRNVKNKNS